MEQAFKVVEHECSALKSTVAATFEATTVAGASDILVAVQIKITEMESNLAQQQRQLAVLS